VLDYKLRKLIPLFFYLKAEPGVFYLNYERVGVYLRSFFHGRSGLPTIESKGEGDGKND